MIRGGGLIITNCALHEGVPKLGEYEGIHRKGPYPRSKSVVVMFIPAYYSRETPLYRASALILGRPHMSSCRNSLTKDIPKIRHLYPPPTQQKPLHPPFMGTVGTVLL